jgi:hypothetical protein
MAKFYLTYNLLNNGEKHTEIFNSFDKLITRVKEIKSKAYNIEAWEKNLKKVLTPT